FEPWKARNAFFNLEKLGAIVSEYEVNFYGIDYGYSKNAKIGLASDRLFAEWHLDSKRVISLFHGENPQETAKPDAEIEIP
ncbi:hypothetical protein WAJ74_22060, partial [Acinetobacter baumannii]